jgi:twitching motility protein PilT
MIESINSERAEHIVTVEDPIEFLYKDRKSIVSQRELGSDTASFAEALKHVLRQDPDVILLGEMRDLETISAAISIAETGHLVFGTLHTTDAIQSINRIIDVFPPHQQQQIRIQLSFVLQAVISQMLIPKSSGIGRVLATEVLVATPAIRNLIRERKIYEIDLVIETSLQEGMISLNRSLVTLVRNNEISMENAELYSLNPSELRILMERF